ncbi:hypothetical protein K8R30_01625 [archaeon]|nr:hypothetical protein [archaeon]
MNKKQLEFIKRLREDLIRYRIENSRELSYDELKHLSSLVDYKKGEIGLRFLPTGKEYSQEFGVVEYTLIRWVKKHLTKEEQLLRDKAIKDRIKNGFNLLPLKKQGKIRKISRENQKKNVIKSKKAEEWVKKKLKKEGWKVERLYEIKDYSLIEGRPSFAGCFRHDELKDFVRGTGREKAIDILYDFHSTKTDCITTNHTTKKTKYNYKKGYMLPDFICRKGKRIKFVEVKNMTNGCSIENIPQSKTLMKLRKEGFEVELINVTDV